MSRCRVDNINISVIKCSLCKGKSGEAEDFMCEIILYFNSFMTGAVVI